MMLVCRSEESSTSQKVPYSHSLGVDYFLSFMKTLYNVCVLFIAFSMAITPSTKPSLWNTPSAQASVPVTTPAPAATATSSG